MAKRNYTKMKKKVDPAVLTLALPLPTNEGDTNSYIDLSQLASIVNRRFYRQGTLWTVSNFKIVAPQGSSGAVSIFSLPTTWVMSNAWEKGFRTWMKMNKESLQESQSIRPKFLDFKIYADAGHHAAGFGANLKPFSAAGGTLTSLWDSAKFSIATSPANAQPFPGYTEEYEVIAVGANYPGNSTKTGLNAVSLIEGYAASRALPNLEDPNTPRDSADTSNPDPTNWLTAIFNDGTDNDAENLENLTNDNVTAPYPFEGAIDTLEFFPNGSPNPNFGLPFTDTMYPGGANQLSGMQIHDSAFLSGTTIGGVTHLKGGLFPCGLIRVGSDLTSTGNDPYMIIDLVPGHHRGYLCEPMTEM